GGPDSGADPGVRADSRGAFRSSPLARDCEAPRSGPPSWHTNALATWSRYALCRVKAHHQVITDDGQLATVSDATAKVRADGGRPAPRDERGVRAGCGR